MKTKTSKNIVNDGEVQINASVEVVTCAQKTSVSHCLEKKNIAIASTQKFDPCSSLNARKPSYASNASKSSAYVSRLASYFSLDFFETSFVFLKCIPQRKNTLKPKLGLSIKSCPFPLCWNSGTFLFLLNPEFCIRVLKSFLRSNKKDLQRHFIWKGWCLIWIYKA